MQIIEPKILKGTREFGPVEMAKRDFVMSKIKNVFSRFGYGPIETPILNLAETILGKYGEEGDRLTYNFEDQGQRRLALPYDLTVPFSRYFAANWRNLDLPFKRYQIQRVWRGEKPTKGRYREFYQCDVDIIGTDSLVAEAEIARVITTVFSELGFNNFQIKTNSRGLMNEILKDFSVAPEQLMPVIRVLDKLDKIGGDVVVEELEKLNIAQAKELLATIRPEATTAETLEKLVKYDTSEIELLLEYGQSLGIDQDLIYFDPSLARGLDYYTGIIFEVVSLDNLEIGSLCGGGRYDNLCGLFCEENFSGMGVAFGFERLMILMEENGSFKDLTPTSQILVAIFDQKSIKDSLGIYNLLTASNFKTEIYFEPAKLKKQFKYADKKKIPFVVIQGPEEKDKNEVTVKSMQRGTQKTMPLEQLRDYFKRV